VIENIERHIHDRHLKNRDHDAPVGHLSRRPSEAMGEVTSAVDRDGAGPGRGLRAGRVLSRARPAGLYQQFALTIAGVDGDLGVQRADADAGAVRRCS
jgi:hypothetical protein